MEKLDSSRTKINNMELNEADENDYNFYDFWLNTMFCFSRFKENFFSYGICDLLQFGKLYLCKQNWDNVFPYLEYLKIWNT